MINRYTNLLLQSTIATRWSLAIDFLYIKPGQMDESACEHAFSVCDVFYFTNIDIFLLYSSLIFVHSLLSFARCFAPKDVYGGRKLHKHVKCVIFSITMTALFKNACEHFPFFFLSKHVCAYSCLLQMVWACWQACLYSLLQCVSIKCSRDLQWLAIDIL